MTGNEIRETFLQYFERHGHTRVRSSPLLPANDPTLLFTNAGMNQFKDVFLGLEKRDYVRACSSQKCVRAGGKHNDLDEVGKTARHQTFFEMLGNFSFGDYFKEDAIKFAWDFLVNELKLDSKRMWFSVFAGDDEVGPDEDAERFWEQVGAPRERILRFGRKDNFWQMGDTGPCGPCSEIHYYMGPDPNDSENNAENVNGPGDTITEIWNLVFMQFDRSEGDPGKYKLDPLPAPSVDTGMGLERLAVVLQGVKSNYETDLLRPFIDFTAKLAGKDYEPETQEGFAMRVIADHARATAFLIADGILPGNEGRNYVLRKIMRRAIYQGRHTLGFEKAFFHQVTDFVVEVMGRAYPELESQREFIEKMVKLEEERFGTTLAAGLPRVEERLKALTEELRWGPNSANAEQDLSEAMRPSLEQYEKFRPALDIYGKMKPFMDPFDNQPHALEAFAGNIHPEEVLKLMRGLVPLYDTFGIPRDLLRVAAEEHGFKFDEDAFNDFFDMALREIQREVHVGEHGAGKDEAYVTKSEDTVRELAEELGSSEFVGYECTKSEQSRVLSLVRGSGVTELTKKQDGEVILDVTPFYAESGGQVGDVGRLVGTDTVATVLDTYSPGQGLIVHKIKVEKGTLKVGDTVTAEVDVEKRDATRRNHTATHLMHAALREVLGTHVKQAGSVVAPTYLRFDFSHYQPLTKTEIEEIENLVNYHILRNEPVETNEMAVEEAMRSGAMALFGEKYGEKVRVLSIKGAEDIFSKELCGGTHVRATGDIGLFKIVSDESIASGVRRIRAVTGADAFARFRESETIIDKVSSDLRTSRAELRAVIGKLQDELKKARREADELRMKIATGAIGTSAANGGDNDGARDVAGVKVLAREASGLDSAGMRQLSDTLLARIKSGVVVLGRSNEGKVSLIVRTSDDLTDRVPAGKVIKELAPIVGGRGGGKADMAEGGGAQPEKLSEALEASYGVVEKLLS